MEALLLFGFAAERLRSRGGGEIQNIESKAGMPTEHTEPSEVRLTGWLRGLHCERVGAAGGGGLCERAGGAPSHAQFPGGTGDHGEEVRHPF